jgi:two-component system C4-dicarboxylate transport response regulator DctD
VQKTLLGLTPSAIRSKIAIIDDEPELAELYAEALRRGGYEVIIYSDSLFALEDISLNHSKFALAVTDIRMPGLNGMELITQLHQKDDNIKFLLISAFGQLSQPDFHYPFLEKPFRMAFFLDTVNTILKPKQMKSVAKRRIINRRSLAQGDLPDTFGPF